MTKEDALVNKEENVGEIPIRKDIFVGPCINPPENFQRTTIIEKHAGWIFNTCDNYIADLETGRSWRTKKWTKEDWFEFYKKEFPEKGETIK